jgi:GTP-binding protein HflX
MQEVTGNLVGLGPAARQRLERLYRRRVNPRDVISPELAGTLAEHSTDTGRQVGLLVDRRGQIEHVIVGDAHRLWLPEIGRLRAARGRFRGLRLVHTHLGGEGLTHDDLTDLALLRLDLVAAIVVEPGGRAGTVHMAHLVPENAGNAIWRELPPRPASRLDVDFLALIRSLEEEFTRTTDAPASTDEGKDRAILVHVATGAAARGGADSAARIAELRELARTAGVRVLDVVEQKRPQADPKTLLGRGKLEQVVLRAMQLGAELLIFDPDLTPGQARTISDSTELKVIDRTMLILDIFAQRAQTRDGKLQVELAQLRYTLPRLVEKNTMMSRLTGGIGGRGPGETKLEISRRRARERISRLEHEIEELGAQRRLRRGQRNRRDVPIVSIVGYTNAGKSTMLNALTQSAALVEDKLFATLDTTSRRLRFPREREVVLTDTVGFIRDLPPDLQRAFSATLEELDDADLLIHVVDAADDDRDQHMSAVDRILGELGLGEKPRVLVFNKIDRLPPGEGAARARAAGAIPVSATVPATLEPLMAWVERVLWREGSAISSARP